MWGLIKGSIFFPFPAMSRGIGLLVFSLAWQSSLSFMLIGWDGDDQRVARRSLHPHWLKGVLRFPEGLVFLGGQWA